MAHASVLSTGGSSTSAKQGRRSSGKLAAQQGFFARQLGDRLDRYSRNGTSRTGLVRVVRISFRKHAAKVERIAANESQKRKMLERGMETVSDIFSQAGIAEEEWRSGWDQQVPVWKMLLKMPLESLKNGVDFVRKMYSRATLKDWTSLWNFEKLLWKNPLEEIERLGEEIQGLRRQNGRPGTVLEAKYKALGRAIERFEEQTRESAMRVLDRLNPLLRAKAKRQIIQDLNAYRARAYSAAHDAIHVDRTQYSYYGHLEKLAQLKMQETEAREEPARVFFRQHVPSAQAV